MKIRIRFFLILVDHAYGNRRYPIVYILNVLGFAGDSMCWCGDEAMFVCIVYQGDCTFGIIYLNKCEVGSSSIKESSM